MGYFIDVITFRCLELPSHLQVYIYTGDNILFLSSLTRKPDYGVLKKEKQHVSR